MCTYLVFKTVLFETYKIYKIFHRILFLLKESPLFEWYLSTVIYVVKKKKNPKQPSLYGKIYSIRLSDGTQFIISREYSKLPLHFTYEIVNRENSITYFYP